MKIRDIITENIFTCDYRLVMDAVASLYKEHYDVDIWSNAEAHDAAAQVLMKEHPSSEELEFIIDTQELPERFQELNFPINDDILGITTSDSDVTEAAPGPKGAEQRMLDRMGARFGLPPGSPPDPRLHGAGAWS